MSAQLLYKMIKSKTEYPLHKAIKVEREDVVFLYLIEMDSQVRSPRVNPLIPACFKFFPSVCCEEDLPFYLLLLSATCQAE